MDGSSCIDHGSTITSDSQSISPALTLTFPVTKLPESQLCRMESATSVILDVDSTNGIESAESNNKKKLPSSRFKGVVPQPNGRWGAQIYEKHQRIWLGTFNQENEAAKAYDIAVQRFRGREAVTNFKPSVDNNNSQEEALEISFLNSRTKAEIVDMLRKHTYNDELEHNKNGKNITTCYKGHDIEKVMKKSCNLLFEKIVTPSDVGKLNRLVIPKQHAERYFPLENGNNIISSKGVLLNFEDMNGKVWRFRYSYWNSSQSYVLTKGWSRFVKEKNLKAGDIVSFQRSTTLGVDNKQLYIDWKSKSNQKQVHDQPKKMLRLFGVNICKVQDVITTNVVIYHDRRSTSCCGDKRMRDQMELLAFECGKKQRASDVL